jgi:hypothetical protein
MDSDPSAEPGPVTEASGSQVKKKGGKGGGPSAPAASSLSGGQYLSVYDFFLNSERPRILVLHILIRISLTPHSVWQNSPRAGSPCCQCRNAEETNVPPSRGLRRHARLERRFQARPRPDPANDSICRPADNANSIVHEGLSLVGLSNTNVLLVAFPCHMGSYSGM